ncbi:helix-turn-helix domain-containing protein [Pseudorhodobacter sp. W20_MBD10_FR17]|uniref:helix-turn-helix domain-containing protein n=1 Tax=Pseudorhodobacter sp. W20_MBD10_FR17 TaxID=3240266 RepID=UPI003F9A9B11
MNIDSASDLGKMIRSRRIELDIDQGTLASLSGVDQGNLSKIERGVARATLDTYIRLTQALGIDILAVTRS